MIAAMPADGFKRLIQDKASSCSYPSKTVYQILKRHIIAMHLAIFLELVERVSIPFVELAKERCEQDHIFGRKMGNRLENLDRRRTTAYRDSAHRPKTGQSRAFRVICAVALDAEVLRSAPVLRCANQLITY